MPCNTCSSCLSRKALSWSQRLQVETLAHPASLFVTLTFNNEHLPILSYDDALLHLTSEQLDEFNTAWLGSIQFIEAYGGLPFVGARPYQLFMKRLRKNVTNHFRNQLAKEQLQIRYFCCMEYGPTTFRPHYHAILFFNNQDVCDYAFTNIRSFWSDYDFHTCKRSSIGNVVCEYLKDQCGKYVSEYVNCHTYLPKVLQIRPFRPGSFKSTCPPIGSFSVTDSQIRKIFTDSLDKFSIKKSDSSEIECVPLWRSLEAAIFPKCLGFSVISHRDRIFLYLFETQFARGAYNSSSDWLNSEWPYLLACPFRPYELLNKLFRIKELSLLPDTFSELPAGVIASLISCTNRIRSVSRRLIEFSHHFGFPPYHSIALIEHYYQRKDYELLKARLLHESELAASPLGRDDSRSLFLSNFVFADVSGSVASELLSHYGFDTDDVLRYQFSNSRLYENAVSRSRKWFELSRKKRVRYDYLEKNPDVAKKFGYKTY